MIAILIALLLGCPPVSIEAYLPAPFGLECVYYNYTLIGLDFP